MKSAIHLQNLVSARTWDKELVLWIGSEKALQQTLGQVTTTTLDLLDLFEPDNLPSDEESTRDRLRDGLRERLRGIQRGPGNRIILVVKSIGLLARYGAGLRMFYDWFIGDFAMVILLLDGPSETVNWPEEVRCEPHRLEHYFSEPGMVKEIFSTSH